MANLEHLAVMHQGVLHWNQWRTDNPAIKPDLSGINLSEADLRDANLNETDLSYTNLSGANLSGATLIGANLSYAQLDYAILRWADSRNALFDHATFVRTPSLSLHLETSLVARGAIAHN